MIPLKVILHTTDQLKLAKKAEILHIDATGSVVRPSIYTKHNIYLFSVVPAMLTTDIPTVAVSDFLTERCRVEEIVYWLMSIHCGVNRVTNTLVDCCDYRKIIVCDFSWAIIHSVITVFCRSRLDQYLHSMFRRLRAHLNLSQPTLFICSSHLLARVSRTVSGFKKPNHKKLFLSCFASLITANSIEDANELWRLMTILFGFKNYNQKVREMEKQVLSTDVEIDFNSQSEPRDTVWDTEEVLDDESLRRSSPFSDYFKQAAVAKSCDTIADAQPNPYFNSAALDVLMRNWLPLYGLWGGAVLQGTGKLYITNAKVETWFS